MRLLPCSVLVCLAFAGCVSPPDRPQVFVETAPPGAVCTVLHAGQPVATVAQTPGIALVPPGSGEVAIECRRNGFREIATVVRATREDAGFFESARDRYPPVSLALVPY